MSIIAGFMVPHPPMIVPEVGRGEESIIEETTKAYKRVADMVAELAPETIVISSPHTVMYADYFHISPGLDASGDFSAFNVPEVRLKVDYDERFTMQIAAQAAVYDIAAGILGEHDASLDHGTMVPLYFITSKYTSFKLVRIGLSGLSLQTHYHMGQIISKVADELDRRVVYIGSGDLSHRLKEDGPYGLNPAGPVYDRCIMDVMGRGAFDELLDFDERFLDEAAECGHRSFIMMAGALDTKHLKIEKLSHQDVTGVGYGICTYVVDSDEKVVSAIDIWNNRRMKRLEELRLKSDPYVRLARASIETYVKSKKTLLWTDVKRDIFDKNNTDSENNRIDAELSGTQSGAFVSIHKDGKLRGCIGTISAVKGCIADEIIENAISASTSDPRFSPITEDELPFLEISVDVLGDAELVVSVEELDVLRYGVIVTKGIKRGLLLPNLDGVDTVDEQLMIAKQKAGLAPDEKGCTIERFEVVRHY